MNTIALRDGKELYYRMEGGITDKQVVVFIPALGDRPDNTWVGNSLGKHIAQTMPGFSIAMPALFNWEEDARNLIDCTLEIHVSDINEFTRHLHAQGAESIHLSGHSLGCLVAMAANHEHVDSLVLYDPSHTPTGIMGELEYSASLQAYVRTRGGGAILGKSFVESLQSCDSEVLASRVNVPTLILNAEEGILCPGGEAYKRIISANQVPVERYVIEGAGHYFSGPHHIDDLVEYTNSWLRARTAIYR